MRQHPGGNHNGSTYPATKMLPPSVLAMPIIPPTWSPTVRKAVKRRHTRKSRRFLDRLLREERSRIAAVLGREGE